MREPRERVRVLAVGRIVHVHTLEGAELIANPAIVLSIGEDDRAFLQLWWVHGFGGVDRGWFEHSPHACEGRWSWPKLM